MNAPSRNLDLEFLAGLSLLYVEDDDTIREELARFLRRRCPKLVVACDGQQGLDLFNRDGFDVVVTDVKMPVMDGLEMARTIKSIQEEVPVIIITAYNEVDYFMRAIEVGVDRYVKKPIDPEELIQVIHNTALVRFRRCEVERKRQSTLASLQEALIAMAHAIDRRNPYTDGHQHRVSQLATAIAQDMGLEQEAVAGVSLGAAIHDIGYMDAPMELLCAPRILTPAEFEPIKHHPRAGFDMLGDTRFPWPIVEIIGQHHERLDGSGYPKGLKGAEILLEARIVAVADVVEAMASDRPHRRALGVQGGIAEIRAQAGVLYDPAVVESCVRVLQREGQDVWWG